MSNIVTMNEAGVSPAFDDVTAIEAVNTASGTYLVIVRAVSNIVVRHKITRGLNNLSNSLDRLVVPFYESVENGKSNSKKSEIPNVDSLQESMRTYEYLYTILSRLNDIAEEKRLTNYSQMAPALRNIKNRTEQLLDIADWIHIFACSEKSAVDNIFASARADLEAGQVYDLADVR